MGADVMSNDPFRNYDSWLEEPYLRAQEEADRLPESEFNDSQDHPVPQASSASAQHS